MKAVVKKDGGVPLSSPMTAPVYFGDITDMQEFWGVRASYLQTQMCPEKELLMAVLIDAAQTLRKLSRRNLRDSRLYTDTRTWFTSKRTDRLFSFRSICLNFDIAPDTILRRMKAYL